MSEREEFLRKAENIMLAEAEKNVAGKGKMLSLSVNLVYEIKIIVARIAEADHGDQDVNRRLMLARKQGLIAVIRKAFHENGIEIAEAKAEKIFDSVKEMVNAELGYELM